MTLEVEVIMTLEVEDNYNLDGFRLFWLVLISSHAR